MKKPVHSSQFTVHSLFIILFGCFLLVFTTSSTFACFGAEFFLGYDRNDPAAYNNAVLIEMYVKEKTGIEVKVLPLDINNIAPLVEKDKIDAAVYNMAGFKGFTKENLTADGAYSFYYRTKITEDLRFSTLKDAFAKLASGLTAADVKALTEQIRVKGKIRRTVKEFLIGEKLW